MEGCHLLKCLLVCKPAMGKRSIGGQKKRWSDMMMEGLKRCDLVENYRDAWRCFVMEALSNVNECMETVCKHSLYV